MRSRYLRLLLLLSLVMLPTVIGRSAARASTGGDGDPRSDAGCPILVLSAMPLEAAPILAVAQVSPAPTWVHDGRGFWEGTLEGARVVIALTGIGMVNATNTTNAAFQEFHCFSLVVFSGTSGGDHIGDVMVPSRWTSDGTTFTYSDPTAVSVANSLAAQPPALERSTPIGDLLCVCVSSVPLPPAPITVTYKPKIEVGGTGVSHDGFGKRAVPCTPAADDVFGCWPCKFPDTAVAAQATNLAKTAPPFADPSFFIDYESASAPPAGTYVSDDMETAAAFSVAAAHGVPVIGFRAASDGGGDPLHLPGFPAEFLVYRQLAADNAATVAEAFLAAWPQDRH